MMIDTKFITDKEKDSLKEVGRNARQFSNILRDFASALQSDLNKITLPSFDAMTKVMAENLSKFAESIEPITKQIEEDKKLNKNQLIEKYRNNFNRSLLLGENGWVASPHINPSEFEEWLEHVENDNYIINNYFDGTYNITNTIITELNKLYKNNKINFYFEKANHYFDIEEYTTAAFFLFGILDNRVNKILDFGDKKRNKTKYSLKGFDIQINKEFSLNKEHMQKRYILVLDMYPSLCAFLSRTFNDREYTFEKGVEPPYLNRNWLFHGRSTREVTRKDCIQILNALSTVEFINRWNKLYNI